MVTKIVGASIKQREDPRLITGQAKYTDDLTLPGLAHAVIVRSPYAHAHIKRINTKKAKGASGVLAVFTGQEMRDAGFKGIPCFWIVPDCKTPEHPPMKRLATKRLRRTILSASKASAKPAPSLPPSAFTTR